MTYPPNLREKARQLRREKGLTIDEIAERLAIGRTTIYHWVYDMPRPERCILRPGPASKLGSRAMQLKYKRLRDEWHELGRLEFDRLSREPTFLEFVGLYLAEGHKRSRNSASLANSDAAAIALGLHWFREFTRKPVDFWIQYHADQQQSELTAYWAARLRIPDLSIRFQRKSNSSQLRKRTWRCEYGVLTIRVHDTYFRARLQGWMDRLRERWLDSYLSRGVAQPGSAHRLGR